jgi:hypothetical protein
MIFMGRSVGDFVTVAPLVVSGSQHLARLDEHFADMLVAVVAGCNGSQVMEIEDIHGLLPFKNQIVKDKWT